MTSVHGMLRIRNEARWIARVIEAMRPLCERIFILDDQSDDGTPEICESFDCVTLFRSPFAGVDETRDKDYLIERVIASANVDDWIAHFDGDEILEADGVTAIRSAIASGRSSAYRVQILYLWDSMNHVRIDGPVYSQFYRPSVFQIIHRGLRFQSTTANGNLHCSSVPHQLLNSAPICGARLLHLGYMHREDRIRKYAWYNAIDPGNAAEDCYRHIVQGDIPEVPASARLRHAGPLQTVSLASL